MSDKVGLVDDCDWVCDVLTDLSQALRKAGYKISPKVIEECRLTLILESANICDIEEHKSNADQMRAEQSQIR